MMITKSEAGPANETVEAREKPARILMVDDEPESLELLAMLLRQEGHDISCATSGGEALHLLNQNPFDLVFLDLNLPDLLGLKVAETMRGTPGLADLPIFFITAFNGAHLRRVAFQSGGSDFITKPVSGEETVARVRVHLELRRKLQRQAAELAKLRQENERMRRDLATLLGREWAGTAELRS